jgi:nicotinamide riboside kinase
MSNKIAISGAHCVGKTTLIKAIQSSGLFKDYEIKTEIVRSLMEKGIKINKGADPGSQITILEEHYKIALNNPRFITDRCSVDAFVYSIWDYLEGNYTFEQHKSFENLFLSSKDLYDQHFFIEPEFPIIKDNVRDEDESYRNKLNGLFKAVYQKYSIPFVHLTGSTEWRYQVFKNTILK